MHPGKKPTDACKFGEGKECMTLEDSRIKLLAWGHQVGKQNEREHTLDCTKYTKSLKTSQANMQKGKMLK